MALVSACQPDRPNPVEPAGRAAAARYDKTVSPLVVRPIRSLKRSIVSGKKVLLYHSDGSSGATSLKSSLVATGLFAEADISIIEMSSTPVALTTLATFDCTVVWTNFPPPEPAAQGDRLKEYVDAGGGVLLMTYGYSLETDPWELQGGIMQNGYSPLDLTTVRQSFPPDRTLDFATALTSHPFLNGVTEFTYGGNDNYVDVTLDPGATLIGSDNTGKALIAVNATRNVGGINVYPGDSFTKTAGVYRTIANGCISVADQSAQPANETETTETVQPTETKAVTLEQDDNGDGTSSPTVGVLVTAGTFENPTDVTVRMREVTADAPCHDFLLGQIGKCVEITATDQTTQQPAQFNNNVTVGVCLPAHLHLEIFKFKSPAPGERANGRVIPLQQVAAAFLNCEAEFASAAPRNWFEGLAMGLSKHVGKWITPKSAYAANRGFGCETGKEGGLSIFTWGAHVELSRSGLAINVFDSGKDAFGVEGILDLSAKNFAPNEGEQGFVPANHDVTVAYGKLVETIPRTAWRFVTRTGRWTYTSSTTVGINYMDIDPEGINVGAFRVAGRTLTQGDALPTTRPFTVQIGHRTQGVALLCNANGSCSHEHQ